MLLKCISDALRPQKLEKMIKKSPYKAIFWPFGSFGGKEGKMTSRSDFSWFLVFGSILMMFTWYDMILYMVSLLFVLFIRFSKHFSAPRPSGGRRAGGAEKTFLKSIAYPKIMKIHRKDRKIFDLFIAFSNMVGHILKYFGIQKRAWKPKSRKSEIVNFYWLFQ